MKKIVLFFVFFFFLEILKLVTVCLSLINDHFLDSFYNNCIQVAESISYSNNRYATSTSVHTLTPHKAPMTNKQTNKQTKESPLINTFIHIYLSIYLSMCVFIDLKCNGNNIILFLLFLLIELQARLFIDGVVNRFVHIPIFMWISAVQY